jgi:ubiquitin carboxyl-terminal hydrolase 47
MNLFSFVLLIILRLLCFIKKSPQTESCTDSGAENEGSCHSDQMSNDFSNDDGVDEGICLENSSGTEKISKPGLEKVTFIV